MISFNEFKEYYMFLDDYLFGIFEQLKATNCFKLGIYTQYEGIIDITNDYITVAYVYLDEYMEYTDFIDSINIPSDIIFDNDKVDEWIKINKAHATFNA